MLKNSRSMVPRLTPTQSRSAFVTCRASTLRLSEAYRVLKPGGRLLCLEFSDVEMPMLDKFYEQWSFNAIPQIGRIVTGDAEPYRYLVESIRKFPKQADFAAMITRAGFERTTWRNYSGGIVALHSAWKL
jgi:demethylmenaquinone methyltransferase/2-methoxy-6-polyprenyl-1,4-benzoquinol methylase